MAFIASFVLDFPKKSPSDSHPPMPLKFVLLLLSILFYSISKLFLLPLFAGEFFPSCLAAHAVTQE